MKILLVEDSPVNCEVISTMLKHLNHQVETAENGQQALVCLDHGEYDLVLMDCDMPVLDGYTTTREIRRREQVQDQSPMPIIALTAYVTSEHYQACEEAGMNDCLTKPVFLNTLRAVLDRWISALPMVKATREEVEVPSLDGQVIKQLEEVMGPEMILQLTQQFTKYAPQQLFALQQLATSHDREALRRKAHQFKSESLQLGATKVGELCKRLEIIAQTGSHEAISTCLSQLDMELGSVCDALNQVNQ